MRVAKVRTGARLAALVVGCMGYLLVAPSVVAAAEVVVQLDRRQVVVGESVVFSIVVSGTQNAPAPQLSGLDDFRVQYAGPSQQMRFENGRASQSISHRYQLFPRKPGNFAIGPFVVEADGAKIQTQAVTLRVLPKGKAAANSAANQLRFEMRLGSENPFVGERVPLTLRLLIPRNVQVDDLKFPVVRGDGARVGEMPQPVQRDERVDGVVYRVLHFETHFTPKREGEAELSATMALSVLQQRRGQRRGLFGMFNNAERRPVEVSAEAAPFVARPLPREGRPVGFRGGVGKYDLKVSASPTAVTAGDPITVRVEVQGDGDFVGVGVPTYAESDGFRVYDGVTLKDLGAGRRGLEQVVIPMSADVDALPPLELSFFDPAAGEYRIVKRGPIPLQVAPAAARASGVVAQGESGRAEQAAGPLGRDIVYIKGVPGVWYEVGASWTGSALFWLGNLIPPLGFVVLWWRSRRERALSANPRLRRFEGAPEKGRLALSSAGSVDEVSAAAAEYFSAKLDLPPGAVSGDRVAAQLRSGGFAAKLCDDVEGFFADLEALRYAGESNSDRLSAKFRGRARDIVEAIESSQRPNASLMKLLGMVALVLSSVVSPLAVELSVADVVREEGSAAGFFAGNHAYGAGNYTDAIAEYEAALDTGEESGALHFNLGNAYFKNGDLAEAIASYVRAGRLLPRDPDVAANLAFAEESLELAPRTDALWKRLVFFISYRFTEAALAQFFMLAWWLLWAVVVARFILPQWQEAARPVFQIGAVIAAVLAVNLYYRSAYLELWGEAVVTAEAGASVRFEPSADGTEHFAASAGTIVQIEGEREGWLMVSRDDGRRGWTPVQEVTRLRFVAQAWPRMNPDQPLAGNKPVMNAGER